jgi:hypothetical protein
MTATGSKRRALPPSRRPSRCSDRPRPIIPRHCLRSKPYADFVLPQDASGQILRDRSHRIEEQRVADIELDRRLEWAKIGIAPPPPTGYPPSPYGNHDDDDDDYDDE